MSEDTKPPLSDVIPSGRGRPDPARLGKDGPGEGREERSGWPALIPEARTWRTGPPGWAPAQQASQTHCSWVVFLESVNNSDAHTDGRKKRSSPFSPTFTPAYSFVDIGSPWIPRQSRRTWPTRPPSREGEQDSTLATVTDRSHTAPCHSCLTPGHWKFRDCLSFITGGERMQTSRVAPATPLRVGCWRWQLGPAHPPTSV